MKMRNILRYLILFLAAFIFVFPVYFMIVASLSARDPSVTGSLIPEWFLRYFQTLFTESSRTTNSWPRSIINSIIVSIASVVITLLVSFPASYIFSRQQFAGDKHILLLLMIMRMLPAATIFIPFLIVYNQIGLYDTTSGLVIAYLSFNVPIAIWLFTSLMDSIPKEIDESAFTDGYGLWQFFRRIFIPLNMPAIGVVTFFVWYQTWSEMFLATVLTQIYGMTLNGNMLVRGISHAGLASAVGVLTMIPGILLLVFARRYLLKAFTLGRI